MLKSSFNLLETIDLVQSGDNDYDNKVRYETYNVNIKLSKTLIENWSFMFEDGLLEGLKKRQEA